MVLTECKACVISKQHTSVRLSTFCVDLERVALPGKGRYSQLAYREASVDIQDPCQIVDILCCGGPGLGLLC